MTNGNGRRDTLWEIFQYGWRIACSIGSAAFVLTSVALWFVGWWNNGSDNINQALVDKAQAGFYPAVILAVAFILIHAWVTWNSDEEVMKPNGASKK